ncbi:MFS transporter [Streptacidiphilus sp. 4-A2]|nr:MFS transporter [Streptacidiphilus sp. 4-A2]
MTAPFAGLLVDRIASRRALLVVVDLVQVLVIASVPVAHAVGHLTLGQLYGAAAVSGVLGGISSIGVPAFVPEVVPKERLVSANTRLAGARSVGQIAGPGVAAALVQAFGAATAMTGDAISYGLSSISMLIPRLTAFGTGAALATRRPTVLQALRDGWSVLRERPALARLAVAAAALNLGGAGLGACTPTSPTMSSGSAPSRWARPLWRTAWPPSPRCSLPSGSSGGSAWAGSSRLSARWPLPRCSSSPWPRSLRHCPH